MLLPEVLIFQVYRMSSTLMHQSNMTIMFTELAELAELAKLAGRLLLSKVELALDTTRNCLLRGRKIDWASFFTPFHKASRRFLSFKI